jgi:hypothetical protein
MLGTFRSHPRALICGGSLAVIALGMAYTPESVNAQEVTCWAESCVNNTCVRVQIQCPKVIVPIRDS